MATPRPGDPGPWNRPLPALCNGFMNRQHLSLGTRDILGWRSWIEGGELLKKSTVRYREATWPQCGSWATRSEPSQPHNRPHSAESRSGMMEEGPYKFIRVRRAESIPTTACQGWSRQGGLLGFNAKVAWKLLSLVSAGWKWKGSSGHPDWNPQEPGSPQARSAQSWF